MLDQHFAHVGVGQTGIDRLCVREEFGFGGAEARIFGVLAFDHLAQRLQHSGQVGLELFHSGAKPRYLRSLEAEEKLEQFGERLDVGHLTAHHLLPVLPQHSEGVVAEDNVVLG